MKLFKTFSDAGSIAVGTYDARTLYKNNYGDGVNRVFICEGVDDFTSSFKYEDFELLGFYECLEAFLFDNDCNGTPIANLSGRYAVYLKRSDSSDQIFVIEKMDEYDREPSEDYMLLRSQEEEIKELYEEIEALKAQIKELQEGRA